MKRTRTEYAVMKGGFNNMFVEDGGLSYDEMVNLKEGERVQIFFSKGWHSGTFVKHESTNVAHIVFDKRVAAKKQKRTFIPNGLEFDRETFDRIQAGSHIKRLERGK